MGTWRKGFFGNVLFISSASDAYLGTIQLPLLEMFAISTRMGISGAYLGLGNSFLMPGTNEFPTPGTHSWTAPGVMWHTAQGYPQQTSPLCQHFWMALRNDTVSSPAGRKKLLWRCVQGAMWIFFVPHLHSTYLSRLPRLKRARLCWGLSWRARL